MKSLQYIRALFLTILFLISGCNVKSQQAEPTITPENTNTVLPTKTQTPTPTETPQPTPTYIFSEMIGAFVDGEIEIDFDSLSREEYGQYSIAISEELNNRIEAPMSFSMNDGQTIYFDEITGQVETISTIIFLKKKAELAPKLYIPAKQDEDGTWMYLDDETDQYIRIENSADVDFSMVIDSSNIDSNGSMIKWYQREDGEPTKLEDYIKDGKFILIPMILIDNDEIRVPIESTYSDKWTNRRGFSILIKKSFGFEKIYIIVPANVINIRDESASESTYIHLAMGGEVQRNQIEEEMVENTVYFAIIPTNPEYEFTSDKVSWEKLMNAINPSDANQEITNYNGHQAQPQSILAAVGALIEHQ